MHLKIIRLTRALFINRKPPAAAVHDIAQYLTNSALSMQIEILSKSYKQCLIML